MNSKALVEVNQLTKSYGATRAVQSVSFQVGPGEAVALLGPNGSGKTTVLRCVAGLLRPSSGTVRVCGLDLQRDYREARRSFGYLPQRPGFPGRLTLREVVQFHAGLSGVSPQRVDESLQEAGISAAEAAKMTSELSGGMRQRLSLALAALPQARVMLLDEPTANLDPEAVLRMRRLARKWRQQGRGVLFSTHVLDDVEELADRVVVLVEGEAVACQSIVQLRANLSQSELLRVDVGHPTAAHCQAALECGAAQVRVNSHSLIVTAPGRHRFAILERLGQLGEIRNIRTEEPSIEQVYISYVEARHP